MDHRFFMNEALDLARKALTAGEFPVGCILVSGDRILATGSRTGTAATTTNEIDHAELNALRKLSDLAPSVNPAHVTVYSTLEPCLMCFSALLLSGIHQIVYAYEDVMGGGTTCDLSRLAPLYRNVRLSITKGVMRRESLALFKSFFENPATAYCQGSLLAEYTLEQELK